MRFSRDRLRVAGLLAGAGVVATLATGCSSSTSHGATYQLEMDTQAVRDAANQGSYSQLRQAVGQLQVLVQNDVSDNKLGAGQGQTIEDAAQQMLTLGKAAYGSKPPSKKSSPPATTSAATTSSPPTVVTSIKIVTAPPTSAPPTSAPAKSSPPVVVSSSPPVTTSSHGILPSLSPSKKRGS